MWFHAQPSYDQIHIHEDTLIQIYIHICLDIAGINVKSKRHMHEYFSFSFHDIRTLVFEPLSFLRISHIPKMNK